VLTKRWQAAESQGRDLVQPGAKLSERLFYRWPGEASPHGLGPASSLPDSFLDLYQFPSCLLFFPLLPSVPRLSFQEKALIEK
jgi:hypothetical protein